MLHRLFARARVERPALQAAPQIEAPPEPDIGETIAAHGRAFARWVIDHDIRGAREPEYWADAYAEMTMETGIERLSRDRLNDVLVEAMRFRGGLLFLPRLAILPQAVAEAPLSVQEPDMGREDDQLPASMIRLADNDDRTELPRQSRKARAREYLGAMSEPVYQSELPSRWLVGKSMVSQWLAEWEQEGLVVRRRVGRDVIVRRADVVDIQLVAVNG